MRVLCLDLQLVICKTVTRSSRLSSPPDERRAWTSRSLHSSQQTQPRPGPKQLHSDLWDVKPFQQRLPWPSKVIFTWFHNRLPFCTSAQLSVLSRHLNPSANHHARCRVATDHVWPGRATGQLGPPSRDGQQDLKGNGLTLLSSSCISWGPWERCQLFPSLVLPENHIYISFNRCLKPMTLINKKHCSMFSSSSREPEAFFSQQNCCFICKTVL